MTEGTPQGRDFTRPDGSPLSIVVAGGGTAGHIEPALAVADAIREIAPDTRITALGTNRGLETTLVPARGYDLRLIPPVPVPRKPSGDLLKLPLRVAGAVAEARKIFEDVGADAVIGFGGYVSAPAYLACRRGRRIPFLVHEANARAGMANKLGVKLGGEGLAAVAGSGMPGDVVGIPVRRALSQLDREALRAEAREFFGLPAEGPVLFVTGGSQGARSINEATSGAAEQFAAAGISVLHAHGKKNTVTLPEGAGADAEHPYVAVPYVDRMDLAYSAADLILCRSGAMSVAEISAVGLPAVYVPLPHGNGEQALNAQPVVNAGGAQLVPDAELTPRTVAEQIVPLARDPQRLLAMSRATLGSGHREADQVLAQIVMEVAGL